MSAKGGNNIVTPNNGAGTEALSISSGQSRADDTLRTGSVSVQTGNSFDSIAGTSSGDLFLATGTPSTHSGKIRLVTGGLSTKGTYTGDIDIGTGDAASSPEATETGSIDIFTGNGSGSTVNETGSIDIFTGGLGGSTATTSGDVQILTGGGEGSSTATDTGGITVRTGHGGGSTGVTTGAIYIDTGDANAGVGSGVVVVSTGTGSTDSILTGDIEIKTGNNTGTSTNTHSGGVDIKTGDLTGGVKNSSYSGTITLETGEGAANVSGSVSLRTGESSDCSGGIYLFTGNNPGTDTAANSGGITMITGDLTNGSETSSLTGPISIKTGNGVGNKSGSLTMYTGTSQESTGDIIIATGSNSASSNYGSIDLKVGLGSASYTVGQQVTARNKKVVESITCYYQYFSS